MQSNITIDHNLHLDILICDNSIESNLIQDFLKNNCCIINV